MLAVLARSLLLTLLALAVAAPAAEADLADQVLPFREAGDGVEAVMGKRTPVLRFGPQAAKLYRGLAGRKASVGCGRQASTGEVDEDEASSAIGFNPNTGLTTLDGDGYGGTEMRLPREGTRVVLPFTGAPYDVCFIATPARRSDRFCLEPGFMEAKPQCVRVLVALNDAGRARVDLRARTIELDAVSSFLRSAGDPAAQLAGITRAFGADVTRLEHPDAAPAAGKVGVWTDGTTRVVAVLLRDGTRKFVRWDGDVYSTNVDELTGGSEDTIRLP